jgi:hypothetical protein
MKNPLIFIIIFAVISMTAKSQDSKKVEKLVNQVSYGVPTSPAFELLPAKPSEVSSLVTPHDITTNITNVISSGKLKTGFAFDLRPFAYNIGSLREYQKPSSGLKRVMWRSVFSVGTMPESEGGNDVFLAVGLRIPIVDGSDPRANANYINKLEEAYIKAQNTDSLPNLTSFNLDSAQKRADEIEDDSSMKEIKDIFLKDSWNKPKWDIGIAASTRAENGDFGPGSLAKDRIGLWTAAGLGITKYFQVTIAAKSALINTKSDTLESIRHTAGVRTRFFLDKRVALSVEYARIWSGYENTSLNESWSHLGMVLELKVPGLGSWVALGYGGESARRTNATSAFVFSYSVSADQILKRKQ